MTTTAAAAPLLSPASGVAVAASPLVYVRGDREFIPVRRKIRFGVDYAVLTSDPHLERIVADAVKAACFDLGKQGFEYDPGLLTRPTIAAVRATVRNFLRETTETGVRAYGDEAEDTDAQVLPHISRALDFTPDPGYVRPPPPVPGMSAEQRHNYRRVCDAVARAERGRVAKDMPEMRDLVDLRIRLPFRQALPRAKRAVASSLSKGKT